MFKLESPLDKNSLLRLKVGDVVQLSGIVLTARDKAHLRIIEHLRGGRELPFELNKAVVYHCGPLIKRDDNFSLNGWKVIAAGPTTSARMNECTVELLDHVESIAIMGKGGMGKSVVKAISNIGEKGGAAVYLAVTGGTGALIAKSVKNVKTVYWEDLGMAEAVWVFELENLNCIVGIDSRGNSLYSLSNSDK